MKSSVFAFFFTFQKSFHFARFYWSSKSQKLAWLLTKLEKELDIRGNKLFQHHKSNFNNNLPSYVFLILKMRWRGLLTMLFTNRENISSWNTCFVFDKLRLMEKSIWKTKLLWNDQHRAKHGRRYNRNDVYQTGKRWEWSLTWIECIS